MRGHTAGSPRRWVRVHEAGGRLGLGALRAWGWETPVRDNGGQTAGSAGGGRGTGLQALGDTWDMGLGVRGAGGQWGKHGGHLQPGSIIWGGWVPPSLPPGLPPQYRSLEDLRGPPPAPPREAALTPTSCSSTSQLAEGVLPAPPPALPRCQSQQELLGRGTGVSGGQVTPGGHPVSPALFPAEPPAASPALPIPSRFPQPAPPPGTPAPPTSPPV